MKPAVRTLKRTADELWSKYVRQDEADQDGYCHCCSCGETHHWKEMDCGHFVSRNHNLGRYKRENCHAQCRKCNRFREGNKAGYAVYLQKRYGNEILDSLNQLQYQTHKFTVDELQELIVQIRKMLARSK
jgi:hypothetical protein